MKKQDENIQEGKSLDSFSRDVIHTNKMPQKGERKKLGLKLNIQKTNIMASGPITSWQIGGETVDTVGDYFWEAPKSLQMVTGAMILKDTYSLEKKKL